MRSIGSSQLRRRTSFLHVARSARHDPRERHADVGGPFTALAAERVLRDAHLVKPSIQQANKQTSKQTNNQTNNRADRRQLRTIQKNTSWNVGRGRCETGRGTAGGKQPRGGPGAGRFSFLPCTSRAPPSPGRVGRRRSHRASRSPAQQWCADDRGTCTGV